MAQRFVVPYTLSIASIWQQSGCNRTANRPQTRQPCWTINAGLWGNYLPLAAWDQASTCRKHLLSNGGKYILATLVCAFVGPLASCWEKWSSDIQSLWFLYCFKKTFHVLIFFFLHSFLIPGEFNCWIQLMHSVMHIMQCAAFGDFWRLESFIP